MSETQRSWLEEFVAYHPATAASIVTVVVFGSALLVGWLAAGRP
jgi:hypothetical protein